MEELTITKSNRNAVNGDMLLLLDDGNWLLKPFSVPPLLNILEFPSVSQPAIMEVINLLGCRANPLDARSAASINK